MAETSNAAHSVDLTIGSPSRLRGRLRRTVARTPSRTRVLLFACLLASLGGALLIVTPGADVAPERAWSLPFLALVVAFGIAEATALHVEIRKESHSLSLSGIPMMFGLLFLSPLSVALAYIAGAAPAMLLVRKSDLVKTTWNLCLFFAEAALAGFIVRRLLGMDPPESALEWLVPLVAVLAAELLSLIAVPLVIMVVDVKFRPNLFADVGQSQILAALAVGGGGQSGDDRVRTRAGDRCRCADAQQRAVVPTPQGSAAVARVHTRAHQRTRTAHRRHRPR
jgi:hypothetical protein